MKKILNYSFITLILIVLFSSVLFNIALDKKKDNNIKTIKFSWWGSSTRHDLTIKVINLFQKKYPNIKVEPVYTSWEGYFEKLNTLIAGNETPDVMQHTIQMMPPYIKNGILADLNKIKTIDTKDETASLKSVVTENGKFYGSCLGVIAPCLIYDKDMFKKAGINVPGPKTTWSDFESMIKLLNQRLKIYGSGYNGLENEFEVYIREKGESFISKDLKKAGFKEETILAFLKMILRMQDNGMEPVKVAIESRSNEENSTYAKDKAAMRFLWSNKIISVLSTKKKPSEITVHPGPNNENGTFLKPACHITISESSKNKDEAGLFASFFINDLEANKILNSERGIPAFGKVRRALSAKASQEGNEQIIKIFKYIDFISSFNKRPLDTNFAVAEREVRLTYRDIAEAVFFKKTSPEDGAKEIVTTINSLLAK